MLNKILYKNVLYICTNRVSLINLRILKIDIGVSQTCFMYVITRLFIAFKKRS